MATMAAFLEDGRLVEVPDSDVGSGDWHADIVAVIKQRPAAYLHRDLVGLYAVANHQSGGFVNISVPTLNAAAAWRHARLQLPPETGDNPCTGSSKTQ